MTEIDSKILIVDDHESNVMLLKRLLTMNHFTNILSTTDSREVLELYQKEKPDLILLDVKMPYLDGFQVLEQLNKVKGDDFLSVIIITAQDESNFKLHALELGAREFIGKPFDPVEVVTRIKNILEMRVLHNNVKEQNRLLEIKVEERTAELVATQLEVIQRLLKAAEFRDDATGYHILRIGYFAKALGQMVGLPESQCEKLYHASMMHDIGKVAIPDSILLKPGKLNDEEWEIMKQHTVKGSHILAGSNSEVLRMGELIALTHHERWDGSGYPMKLRQGEIHIASRITTICDVFDALLSKRSYKEPWEVDQVVEEIKRSSGTIFDPMLCEILLENLQTFLDIRSHYS